MGEQRPLFRFRLPWMISSAAAPPPVAAQNPPRAEAPSTTSQLQTKIEPNVNPTVPARRPFRLSSIAPASPPPPIQPTVESQSQSEPIMFTSTPKILPQASPLWSPKISLAQDPRLQAEVLPKTMSQSENSSKPTSPSKTHSQPTQLPPSPQLRNTSMLPSPQLSATSQPSSPKQMPSQERDTSQLPSPKSISQPSSPWRTSSKAKDASQTSSPWHTSSKARDTSQPSLPDRTQFQNSSQAETFQQPHSLPQFQSTGQKSPIMSSPSLTATNVHQTKATQSPPRAESPWRTSSKGRDTSQPSSPDRTQFQNSSQAETFQQPHSPPQFQSTGRKTPITSSPSLTATNVHQTKATQSPPRAESPSSTFQPQTNNEPNVNPMTPIQRPFRLPSIAPAQPPPPIQTTVQSQSQSEPITITSGPTFPPQRPPLWSPKISATIDPLRQPEVSLERKSQSQRSSKPASPSKTHSHATSQLPSPSSTSAQSSATSQLPSQLSATPQPPSPWQIPSQERDTARLLSKSSPQLSSPMRESSKERDGSQPSSPDRHLFQKSLEAETVKQPRSPSQMDLQPSWKTSLSTASPSLTDNKVQQTERTESQLPSPSMMSTHIKSPQPSTSSDKLLSPVSVKPSVAISQPQSLEDQSMTKFTPSPTFKSPTKATVQPHDNVANPPKRDIEMVQNTSLAAQEELKKRTMAVPFTETSGLALHDNEKLKIASQAEQGQLKNQNVVYGKEVKIPQASSLDEKQTKTMTLQQTDHESTVSESLRKRVIPNKDRVPFQKELRNDIFMFADKMSIAHTEKYKDEQLASVIALVGKNKGAFMKLGFESAKGEGSFTIQGANKIEPVEGTEENGRNKSAKHRRSNNEIDQENQTTKAYINNNVQDINNSIMMDCFITERNPGVHLALYYNPTEPIMSYGRKGFSEARKAKSRLPLPKSLHMSPPSEGDT